jgi:hypothetical protein
MQNKWLRQADANNVVDFLREDISKFSLLRKLI